MPQLRTSIWARLGVVCVACSFLPSASIHAQSSLDAQRLARARDACNAVAAKEGYRIIRRDHETLSGVSYTLPFHVAHGTTETDVTCRYDDQRHLATLPTFETLHVTTTHTVSSTGSTVASRRCVSLVNAKKGYTVERVGDVTARGRNLWDVALRVRRAGKGTVDMTCRYNGASGKYSLR